MPCAGFSSELYDLYALGVLESADAAQIDEHLASSCETCQQEVQQSLERAATFALAVPSVVPPRRLRARIVETVRPARTGFGAWLRLPALGWAVAAACFLVAVGASWFLASRNVAVSQPVITSHVSPPPVVLPVPLPQSTADLNRAPALPVHEDSAEVALLQRNVAQQRNRIQELEAQVHTKDVQLDSAEKDRSALQIELSAASRTNLQAKELQQQLATNREQLEELTQQVQFYRTGSPI